MRKIRPLIVIIVLAMAPVAARDARCDQATAGDTGVSSQRLARHVAYLASQRLQGRRSGTPGADRAAAYIAREFRTSGLKPPGRSFLQPFTFVSGVRLGKGNSFHLKTTQDTHALKLRSDYMPLAFSSRAMARGEVVFVGYGISAPELQYDDYAETDVTGKIVMLLRGSPDGDDPHGRFADYTAPGLEVQKKTIRAREKGARGVIFISAEEDFEEDRLSHLRHDTNFLDAGIPAVIVSRRAAGSLLTLAGTSIAEAESRATGKGGPLPLRGVTVEFTTDVVKIVGQASNVVGILDGGDPQLATECVIIGAHYDHLGLGGPESLAAKPEGQIHYGADDNASGTAALLELARVLAANRAGLKRSIIFIAFAAEEIGLLGSAAYTRQAARPLASTVAMLNMDMVGRLRNRALFVGGAGTSPAWPALLERANAGQFVLSTGQDGFGPGDHQSFYVRDMPVLFFFSGTHEDYHKPSDTADKINVEGIRKVAEFVRAIAVEVAAQSPRIAFTKVKTTTQPMASGFRVYLGTVPNYADQSEGMKLDGVRPGSPAERAGLRAGDVILKVGRVPVKNVYDYTYALGELRGGVEIEVAIRRAGREMTFKVTPDKRQ